MREILYRAKAINRDRGFHRTDYENGDWVYGLITRLYDKRFENLPAEMTDIDGVGGIEVDYKTVGQYTGLIDKNEVMIFEGDIVSGLFKFHLPVNSVVDFRDGAFGLLWYRSEVETFWAFTSICNVEYEVIGNIHDNPELLEGQEGVIQNDSKQQRKR